MPPDGLDASGQERLLLISTDCHAGPPLPGFRPYVDPEHRDAFDAYCRARPNIALAEAALRGDHDAVAAALGAFMRATGASEEAAEGFCRRAAQMTAGLFDSKVRNECLDAEGIAAEVIFSDGFVENHPPFSDAMETGGRLLVGSKGWAPELRLAGARAHNRWPAEFCAESR